MEYIGKTLIFLGALLVGSMFLVAIPGMLIFILLEQAGLFATIGSDAGLCGVLILLSSLVLMAKAYGFEKELGSLAGAIME